MASVVPLQLTLMELGIDRAAATRMELLADLRVRLEAIALARAEHTASIDDVDLALADLKRSHADLGNAAGAVFRDGRWRFTGRWQASTRASNHARPVRVWQLK